MKPPGGEAQSATPSAAGPPQGVAKPRNPRHFDTIEGRRSSTQGVKDTCRHYMERVKHCIACIRHFETLFLRPSSCGARPQRGLGAPGVPRALRPRQPRVDARHPRHDDELDPVLPRRDAWAGSDPVRCCTQDSDCVPRRSMVLLRFAICGEL